MIHEFAVDPEALTGWQNFRYVVEKFGIPQGRLISRFPKEWKRLVYDACAACLPVEKAKIEVMLRQIDSKLFKAGRNYDRNVEWFPNAVASHRGNPFRAIITHAENASSAGILDVEALSEDNKAWAVPRGGQVPRTAAAMAAAAEKLLRCSAEVVFVDPHFGAAARFGKPLTAMIGYACSPGRVLRRFEYHLSGMSIPGAGFRKVLESQRPHLRIPDGVQLVFVRWSQFEQGDALHPRYILTEKGGLRFDHGLDEGDPGETTDVECIDPDVYSFRWEQFRGGSSHFNLVDAWIVSSRTVVQAKWENEVFVPL